LIRINAGKRQTRHDADLQAGRDERMLAGITLLADEIKATPLEVRRCIEQEILPVIGVQLGRRGLPRPC